MKAALTTIFVAILLAWFGVQAANARDLDAVKTLRVYGTDSNCEAWGWLDDTGSVPNHDPMDADEGDAEAKTETAQLFEDLTKETSR